MKLISLGRVVGVGAFGLAIAAVACTTSDDGGDGDNSSGGTTGSGGATNGTGGAGNGDAGAGSGGTPAGACTTMEASALPSAPPPAAFITDFSEPCLDEMDEPTGHACFGAWPNFYGGTWGPYPEEGALSASIDNEDFNVSGTVDAYAGFGVWFRNGEAGECIDASSYSGIGFTISGDAGPSGSIRVTVRQRGNVAGTDASTLVDVTDTPTQVELSWSDFTGGSPVASVTDTDEITGLQWDFDWIPDGDDASTEYAVDVTVDDLTFLE